MTWEDYWAMNFWGGVACLGVIILCAILVPIGSSIASSMRAISVRRMLRKMAEADKS